MPREIPPKGAAKPAAKTRADAAKKAAASGSIPKPALPAQADAAPSRAATPAKAAAGPAAAAALPATALPATAIPTGRFSVGGASIFDLPSSVFAVPAAFDVTAATPVITRGGREVPPVKLDRTRLEEVFIVPPKQQQTRVVGQDPPAGTFIPRGSTVNLFVAPVGEIPFEVFEQPHLDFSGKTLADLAPVLEDSRVRAIVDKNASAGTVPEADRKILTDLLKTRGVEITEDDPQRSFDRAFRTVREASVFG